MKKRITSKEIARIAGVSRSTVSRVINGYANVPEATREKVMAVVKQYHYYPQLSGQLLTGMRNRTIGLFWVSKAAMAGDPLSSLYFMQIVDAATKRGYLVLSCVVENLTEKKNLDYVRKIFMEGRIEAGIFVGTSNHEPLIDELAESGAVVGMFDFFHENDPYPNRLSVNFEGDSGEKAVEYLYSLGHRKIGVIDGDMSRLSSVHRHESFVRGMVRRNLPIQNKWIAYGGITEKTGYAAAKEMLTHCGEDLPTAIFANNDTVAFGVYAACRELGLSVPGDISVIGVDGHVNGQHAHPPLTTIAFDFEKMFTSLVYRVLDTVEQKEGVPQSEFIAGTLVVRESCRPIRGTEV